jgi:CheY-like chemotaxis protein
MLNLFTKRGRAQTKNAPSRYFYTKSYLSGSSGGVVEQAEQSAAKILVVADLEYLRDGIQALLQVDGYHVTPVRGVREATDAARTRPPDLILMTLDLPVHDMAAAARRIRKDAGLDSTIPILLFCIPTVAEGDDAPLGDNTWAAHPADFNQLREILRKLLAAMAT